MKGDYSLWGSQWENEPPDDNPDEWCRVCGTELVATDCKACDGEGVNVDGTTCETCKGEQQFWSCPNEPHTPEFMAAHKAEIESYAAHQKVLDEQEAEAFRELDKWMDEELAHDLDETIKETEARRMSDGSNDPEWMERVMMGIAEIEGVVAWQL